jgi:hypothetical protein
MEFEPGSRLELVFWVGVLLVSTIGGIAVLVGMTWGLNWVLGDLVAAAIVAAAAPIVASLTLAIWNEHAAQIEAVAAQRRTNRGAAYADILSYLAEAVETLDDDTAGDGYELAPGRQSEFAKELLVWGSDELIELWNDFRGVDFDALTTREKRDWYARLLKQVRQELGGRGSDMSADELYELYSAD